MNAMMYTLFIVLPCKNFFFVSFSEESNIEYRTRNNECLRIIEHLILNNAEEILPSELFVQRWIRKLHNSKFLVRYCPRENGDS